MENWCLKEITKMYYVVEWKWCLLSSSGCSTVLKVVMTHISWDFITLWTLALKNWKTAGHPDRHQPIKTFKISSSIERFILYTPTVTRFLVKLVKKAVSEVWDYSVANPANSIPLRLWMNFTEIVGIATLYHCLSNLSVQIILLMKLHY